MRKIWDIYDKYKIMPNLREHMLRVASVASLICDNFTEQVNKEDIITACLLHDMGNIIKFDLSYFPKFTAPEGLEYWQKIKNEYVGKYGQDEHQATLKIAAELNMPDKIIKLINAISFFGAPDLAAGEDYSGKIMEYADRRVGPNGILSVEERLMDLRKRYDYKGGDTPERRAYEKAQREIEKQIFAKCKIKPEDINDETTKPLISKLKEFVIK